MTESREGDRTKKPLGLSRPGRLELKKTVETGQVRQSFPHGRSKAVTVEVKRKRTFTSDAGGLLHEVKAPTPDLAAAHAQAVAEEAAHIAHTLTDEEKAARVRALKTAVQADHEARKRHEIDEALRLEEEARARADAEARRVEEEARKRVEEEARLKAEADAHKAPEAEPSAEARMRA